MLVGEVTLGGAPNVVGRTEIAITNIDWQGKGVQLDLATSVDHSFITGYLAALHALGRQTLPTAK